MRTLLIEPFGGVAGDMLVSALLGLGVDFQKFETALSTLPISDKWKLSLTTVERHAISAKHFKVEVETDGGDHRHHHHSSKGASDKHTHTAEAESALQTNSGHHHHRSLDDVLSIINGASGISDTVKERASAVFAKLAEAEAEVHGKDDPRGVHFHEVGAVDAIIDITGACLAIETLGVDRVVSAPVPLGTGTVSSAHGVLPVPVPATVNLLRGVPTERTSIPYELATPTGSAILAVLADEWLDGSSNTAIPADSVMLKSAYGAGTRDIPQRAGVLRATLYESSALPFPSLTDRVSVLECEMDDLPGETMTWLSAKLPEAGALDHSVTAVMMKKNRPGISLRVICEPEKAAQIADVILRETTTLGVRHSTVERFKLRREIREIKTPLGEVSAKFAYSPDDIVVKAKPEYEDVAKLAEKNALPFSEALKTAEAAVSTVLRDLQKKEG